MTAIPDTELTRLQFVAMSARLQARTALNLVQQDRAEAAQEPRNKVLLRRAERIEPALERASCGEAQATRAFCEAFERALVSGQDVSRYAASYGRLRAGASANDITYGALKAAVQVRAPRPERAELAVA